MSSLQKVDISNFYNNETMSMNKIFSECTSLKELNLSNFKNNKKMSMQRVFSDCPNDFKINNIS